MYFKVSELTSARQCIIFAAFKWIRSTLCSNAGEQYAICGTRDNAPKVNGFQEILG